ncbi:export-related chaperone CsaA, partial [mine drainage metagenome]
MVSIDEFSKIEMRIGKVIGVEEIEKARAPLYALRIDLGLLGTRNIAAGIRGVYSKDELIGKMVVVVVNLEPKKIAGFISEGMVLAAEESESV